MMPHPSVQNDLGNESASDVEERDNYISLYIVVCPNCGVSDKEQNNCKGRRNIQKSKLSMP